MSERADYGAIEARLAARTPGEWHASKFIRAVDPELWARHWGEISLTGPNGYSLLCGAGEEKGRQCESDADLIAHAPEDIACLLARVRRYEAALQHIATIEKGACGGCAWVDRHEQWHSKEVATEALADDAQTPADDAE